MTGRNAVCLFAGLGGTAYGQHRLVGNNVVAVVDHWSRATESLLANRDALGRPHVGSDDVKTVDFRDLTDGPTDVLLGGPPCQPFSQASQVGLADADPRDCIPDFIRATAELEPRLVIMEEVKTLTYAKNAAYLASIVAAFNELEYHVDVRVLDASDYGVPQARKRMFLVARKDALPVWPDANPDKVTMADALGWSFQDALDAQERARALTGAEWGDPHWVMERPSTTVVGSFRPEIQAAPGYRKAGDPPRQRTPGSVYITEAEALTLQGMPSDWQIAGNANERRLQIGNSCPPQLTAALTIANTPKEA